MTISLFLKANPSPPLSTHDQDALAAAAAETRRFAARRVIVRQRTPLAQSALLLDGFVERYKLTPDGRRQIVGIHIPGDFIDLHSLLLKRLEHDIGALTPVELAVFPHDALRRLTAESPTLTELLWRSTLVDGAMSREWILSIGARSAAVRIAHLLCEMHVRLGRIGLAQPNRFALPLTQVDLADATGLTPVHANRMLRRLREQDIVTFRDGEVTFASWDRLRSFAEFDDAYLYGDDHPDAASAEGRRRGRS